jgi:hypothetical protein
MSREDILRKRIRELIEEILGEISTTGSIAGYLTPLAFRGNSKKALDRTKHIATKTGYQLTPRGEKELTRKADRLEIVRKSLGENRYLQYKNDPTQSPNKKIAAAISRLNKDLDELSRILKMNSRLKDEMNIPSEKMWKRTQKGLYKLESRLLKLANRTREMRGK